MKLKSASKDELKDRLAAKATKWIGAERERLRKLEREANAPSPSPEVHRELMLALKNAHKALSTLEALPETRDMEKSNIRPALPETRDMEKSASEGGMESYRRRRRGRFYGVSILGSPKHLRLKLRHSPKHLRSRFARVYRLKSCKRYLLPHFRGRGRPRRPCGFRKKRPGFLGIKTNSNVQIQPPRSYAWKRILRRRDAERNLAGSESTVVNNAAEVASGTNESIKVYHPPEDHESNYMTRVLRLRDAESNVAGSDSAIVNTAAKVESGTNESMKVYHPPGDHESNYMTRVLRLRDAESNVAGSDSAIVNTAAEVEKGTNESMKVHHPPGNHESNYMTRVLRLRDAESNVAGSESAIVNTAAEVESGTNESMKVYHPPEDHESNYMTRVLRLRDAESNIAGSKSAIVNNAAEVESGTNESIKVHHPPEDHESNYMTRVLRLRDAESNVAGSDSAIVNDVAEVAGGTNDSMKVHHLPEDRESNYITRVLLLRNVERNIERNVAGSESAIVSNAVEVVSGTNDDKKVYHPPKNRPSDDLTTYTTKKAVSSNDWSIRCERPNFLGNSADSNSLWLPHLRPPLAPEKAGTDIERLVLNRSTLPAKASRVTSTALTLIEALVSRIDSLWPTKGVQNPKAAVSNVTLRQSIIANDVPIKQL
ncbi:hypothetical protein MMC22_005788 [Lobaria immixta]|nr:hypothetical protein [Lobaria immixta]